MYHDNITGLPVYESFLDFSQKMRTASERNRFAILSLNMKSFHRINQIYGYQKGNDFLTLLTQKLIRKNSYMLSACRIQADSFVVLIDVNQITLESLKTYVESAFSDFTTLAQPLYPEVKLVLHGGIYLLSDYTTGIHEAIEHADIARNSLDELSSSASGNMVTFYQDSLLGRLNPAHKILPLFEDIMVTNHLIIYLQPKFDIDDLQPIGAEALVRIMDSNGKILKPNAFLSVLERYGFIHELDLMVIESILKIIDKWYATGIQPIPISINLSGRDFSSEEFTKIFAEMMEKYPSALKYIEFEISESTFFDNPEYMLQEMNKLHNLGYRITMDAFGKNSFALNTYGIPPVDTIKLNRSFLNMGMKNTKNFLYIQKLIETFRDCNISVICEGIENKEEEDFAKECGCRFVQGYYYDRPMPLDIFQKKYMEYSYLLYHV